jgi:small conductance mechanosensitive channel
MAIELDINLLYQALTVALILAVTYVFGRIIARFFRETLKKAGIPETETIILASIVRYSAYLIGISIALGYLNIPTVSLWIALVLGVAVIGISARSTLDNIVSGYFLRTYGPFNIGDVIEADGRMGAIKDMTLMKTVMETPEHLVFSIPNSKIVQSEIYNFTRHKSECPVELEFELSQDADLEDVKLKILDIVSSYPRISVDKPVQIYLQRFTQRGLWLKIHQLVVRCLKIPGQGPEGEA